MPAKLLEADIPEAMQLAARRLKSGFDLAVAEGLNFHLPTKLQFQFEVITHKDALARAETSINDPSIATTVTQDEVSTTVQAAATVVTNSQSTQLSVSKELETSFGGSVEAGGEISNGNENGLSAGKTNEYEMSAGGSVEAGGEISNEKDFATATSKEAGVESGYSTGTSNGESGEIGADVGSVDEVSAATGTEDSISTDDEIGGSVSAGGEVSAGGTTEDGGNNESSAESTSANEHSFESGTDKSNENSYGTDTSKDNESGYSHDTQHEFSHDQRENNDFRLYEDASSI